MRFLSYSLTGCILWLMTSLSVVGAYENATHMRINQRAPEVASINQLLPFDGFLKNSLGLIQGLGTPFKDANGTRNENGRINTVVDWLRLGGVTEDTPLCRPARHFHDPLQPWTSAGLSTSNPFIDLICGSSFPSSVIWAQDRYQDLGEQRSWFEARASYFNALTGSSEANRDQAWASTFQTLGQLMHLVADASVPEHVRNDTHILSPVARKIGIQVGSYEWWVEKNLDFFPFSGAPPFDRAILRQPTNTALAPIPIARLFDTDTYTGVGSGPGVTLSPAIGVAEFANANFFSSDTGNRNPLRRGYPFPALDLLVESQLQAPRGTNIRRYYKKGNDGGLPVDPVLAECVFDSAARVAGLAVPGTYNCVDGNVWRATATQMVPRAVDYTAGLLEYFFRGQLEIATPARFAYGLAAFQPGNGGAFTKLRFKVRNATPDEDSPAPGQMIAVVQYRTAITNESLIDSPFADISDQLFFAVSQPLDPVTLTSSFQEFVFDFTRSPLPTNSADLFLTVVYKGRLGLEDDAVMVGGKDLFEPDPLDVGNATDWECFQGTLYPVADVTAYPPYQPPGQKQRDVNQDGVQDLFGPAVTRNDFIKTFDLARPVPIPSENSFDFSTAQESFAQYGRVMLLQDEPSYGAAVLTRQTQEIPSGTVQTNIFKAVALRGVFNDVVLGPAGERVRRVLLSSVYRGVPLHHAILLVTPGTVSCLPQTPLLTPDLTRIEGVLPAE